MTARHIDATDKTDGSMIRTSRPTRFTGAIIAIEGPKSLQLSDVTATAIVGGVQKRLTDKVEIIWGLNFTDEDVLRATVLLAIQQK